MSEELERESLEVDPSDLEKVAGLLDDSGNLPTEEPEQSEPEPQAQKTATEAEPKTEAESEDQTAEIEYEGAKYAVPAKLKDAFLRQADYTRKTQEVSQLKAAAEQERQLAVRQLQEAQQFVGQYAAIQQIDNQLNQFQKVDWQKLAAEDPLQNLQLRQAWTELVYARQAAEKSLNDARQSSQLQQLTAVQEAVKKGNEVLAKEIPNWGPETQKALFDTAQQLGYRPDELAMVTDPRAVKLLDLARDGLKFREQKISAEKQVKQAPPRVVRPSASQGPQDGPRSNEHLQRLRKTGRDEDALAAIKQLGLG